MSFSQALVSKKVYASLNIALNQTLYCTSPFVTHIGSGWDGLYFHFSSPCSAVLCISSTGVLVTHRCFGCCWAVLTQHQGCVSKPPPKGQQAEDGQEVWRGESWGTWCELTQKILHTVCITLSHKREGYSGFWCLPSEGIAMCTNSPLPRNSLEICLLARNGE